MFTSLLAFLEFVYHLRVDVSSSKITTLVKQFVHRHACNTQVIVFLNSVSKFAKFEPCRLLVSELAAALLNDTTIYLDLSGHDLCKMIERLYYCAMCLVINILTNSGTFRLHVEFTLSSETLRQLVVSLQSVSSDRLSVLLLALARNNFADETSAICFNNATQYLEIDQRLLIELFGIVVKSKPKTTVVLDGCFAR